MDYYRVWKYAVMARFTFEIMLRLFIDVLICCGMGGLIGFLCQSRPRVQVWLAVLVSSAYFAFVLWRFGDPGEWSGTYPLVSALYQIGPYAAFYLLPTFGTALLVSRWRR